ncbi:hypothetical protein QQP08_027907 [Theobroma cacao]|nr:hypothetical protein QQP08_027907 [Theobroma cacao]
MLTRKRQVNNLNYEYDRAIDEAIELTKRRKTVEEQRQVQKLAKQSFTSNGGSDVEGSVSEGSSDGKGNSMGSDTEDDKLQEAGGDGNKDDGDYSSSKDGDDDTGSDSGNSADGKENLGYENHEKDVSMASRWSKRLSGVAIHPAVGTGNLGTKNRLRQRPVINSALDIIVPDSEDDISLEHTNSGILGPENLHRDADPEEVSDS